MKKSYDKKFDLFINQQENLLKIPQPKQNKNKWMLEYKLKK